MPTGDPIGRARARAGDPRPGARAAAGTRRRLPSVGGRGPRAAFSLVALLTLALLAAAAPGSPGRSAGRRRDPPPYRSRCPPASSARVARDLEAAGLLRDHRALVPCCAGAATGPRRRGPLRPAPRPDVAQIADALVRGGRPRTARFVLPEGIRANEVVRASPPPAGTGTPRGRGGAPRRRPARRPAPRRPARRRRARGLPVPRDLRAAGALRRPRDRGACSRASSASSTASCAPSSSGRGLDVHAWVTLASMVQAEAGDDTEMAIIAGVFLNRLDAGMPLQSDPTVAYGLGKALPELDFPGGDFDVDHPWNTYTRPGCRSARSATPARPPSRPCSTPQRTDAPAAPGSTSSTATTATTYRVPSQPRPRRAPARRQRGTCADRRRRRRPRPAHPASRPAVHCGRPCRIHPARASR
jgi:UPF0755 protein